MGIASSRDIWGQTAAAAPGQAASQPPPHSPSPPLSPVAAGANAPFTLVGSEEQRQVDALCAKGGMKLAPAKESMDAFARACGGLRAEAVAQALAAKIRDGEWQEGYKAACVIEHVAKGGVGDGCEAVAVAFASGTQAGTLDGAGGSSEKLRFKAAEAKAAVTARLNGVARQSVPAPVPVPAPSQGVDLFGLMGDAPAAAAPPRRPPLTRLPSRRRPPPSLSKRSRPLRTCSAGSAVCPSEEGRHSRQEGRHKCRRRPVVSIRSVGWEGCRRRRRLPFRRAV